MEKCIFCMQYFEESNLTNEHVFPESIGGTLKIRRLCKNCNSKLGSRIDYFLSYHLLIQFKRFINKTPGKTGKIPNPLRKVFEMKYPDQTLKVTLDKAFKPYVLPHVGENSIIVDASDEQSIFGILNKTLSRQNLPILTEEQTNELLKNGTLVVNNIELSSKRIRVANPKISAVFRENLYDFFIAILKISYEMTFRWLGEDYLSDKTAEKIRNIFSKFLLANGRTGETNVLDLFNEFKIRGQIEIGSLDILKFMNLGDDCHVALLIRVDNEVVCCIQIFDQLSGCIVVSEDANKYKGLECGKFLHVSSTSKTFKELTFVEAVQSLRKTDMK